MNFNFNYVDLIIVVIFSFFILEAFRHGFFTILADAMSFLLSLVIAFRYYRFVSDFLLYNFNFTKSISKALAFLTCAILTEFILGFVLGIVVFHIHRKFKGSVYIRALGIIPAVVEASLFIIFILTLTFSFPINPKVKADIEDSVFAPLFLNYTHTFEKQVNEVFGGVIDDSINYFTIKPESNERILLKYPIDRLEVDTKSEAEMYIKVNTERNKLSLSNYIWDEKLAEVGRNYATKLWQEQYFGHVDSEGKDVGDRLTASNIKYQIAGENLALAPTINIAHTGLMNSEGHRKNILDNEFSKIGIGVVDNGIYGKIFVQIFVK